MSGVQGKEAGTHLRCWQGTILKPARSSFRVDLAMHEWRVCAGMRRGHGTQSFRLRVLLLAT